MSKWNNHFKTMKKSESNCCFSTTK